MCPPRPRFWYALAAAGSLLALDAQALPPGPVIPEPSSIVLFLLGLGAVGYGIRRRRR